MISAVDTGIEVDLETILLLYDRFMLYQCRVMHF